MKGHPTGVADPRGLTYGNGLGLAVQYDQDYQPLSRSVGAVQSLAYGIDPAGDITAIADNLTARSQTFQYDALQRLTQASGIYGTLAYAWRRVSAAAAGAERTFARRGHAAKTEAPRRARGAACLSAG